jgi:hypothetical protein
MLFDEQTPKHVILFKYDHKTKTHVRYDALVIGVREFEDHDEPVLNLVYFRHDDTASHHALNGVDWADTLERILDVPHEDDLENQSFYYVEEDASVLRKQLDSAREVLREYDKVVDDLRAQLAATTEGKDAALQAIADAGAAAGSSRTSPVIPIDSVAVTSVPVSSLPSGDAPVATETKNYSDGSSATGPGPLPDQSPAQQDAASAQTSTSAASAPSSTTEPAN